MARGDKGLDSEGSVPFTPGGLDAASLLPKLPDTGGLLFQCGRQCCENGNARRQDPVAAREAAEEDGTRILPEFFSEAFGTPIGKDRLPAICKLMRRMRRTQAPALASLRPFVLAETPHASARPKPSAGRKGPLPQAAALLLNEIDPARAGALLKRGMQFGQSRIVCGCLRQTDANAGSLLAGAILAKLHASPECQADLERSRAECGLQPGSPERKHRDKRRASLFAWQRLRLAAPFFSASSRGCLPGRWSAEAGCKLH